MYILISLANLKSVKIRELICGKPRILIYRGKIDEKAMKDENLTIDELQERLRSNNINNIGDVEFAILETSGQVSVVPKPQKRPLNPDDFNIKATYEGISLIVSKIFSSTVVLSNTGFSMKKDLV